MDEGDFFIGILIVGGTMPANLEEKIQLVNELADKFGQAKSIIVVDYRGLNVEELNDLRKQTREEDVEYKVYKNTMVRRALDQAEIEGISEYFVGPTAVAISQIDEVTPARILNNFAKDHNNLEIKVGYVSGQPFDLEQVKSLASLPPKEELVAKALGGLNAPITGLAGVLNATIRGLAIALGQIAEQKQNEEAE